MYLILIFSYIEFYVTFKCFCHRSVGSTLNSSPFLFHLPGFIDRRRRCVLSFVETIPSIIQNVEYSELRKNHLSLRIKTGQVGRTSSVGGGTGQTSNVGVGVVVIKAMLEFCYSLRCFWLGFFSLGLQELLDVREKERERMK